MAQAKPARKLTYDDYCNTPDDQRWELINGELIMAPTPNTAHQTVSGRLFLALTVFVKGAGLGQVFIAPLDVVLSNVNVVQPDLLFISNARQHILTDANVQGAPDLVVEVLSPSTASRDWRAKVDIYAQHGVQEYWLVDPEARRVWVMARTEDALTEVANYGPADTLTSPTLQGFTANLSEVFQARR